MRILLVFIAAFLVADQVHAGLFGFLRSKIGRIHKVHDFIHEVFKQKGHDPNSTILNSVYPEAVELLRKKASQLEKCYDASLGNTRASIFEMPLGNVIQQYLGIDLRHHKHSSRSEFRQKIHNLLENIKEMAKLIIECVKNEDAEFLPTQLGLTKFASWSQERFRQLYLQPLPPLGRNKGEEADVIADFQLLSYDPNSYGSLPEAFDYRDLGVVSLIKDQANCGACVLFGTMASIESSYMLKHNQTNVTFSEKDLFNCLVKDGVYTDMTCDIGMVPQNVLYKARKYGVILASQGDEYMVEKGRSGKFNFHPEQCGTKKAAAYVKNFAKLQNTDGADRDDKLKSILMKYGPLATTFRADERFKYNVGLWNSPCNQTEKINHVMTIVGWTKSHWIIKNSYGNHKSGDGVENWKKPFGVDGWLYARKKYADTCGIFGQGSYWLYPDVE